MARDALYISVRPDAGAKTVDSFWVLDLRVGDEPSDRGEKFQKMVDDTALDPFYPMWPSNNYNGLAISSDGTRIAWPSSDAANRTMYLLKTDTLPGTPGERLLQNTFGGSAYSIDIRHTDDLIALGVSGTGGIHLYTKEGVRVNTPDFAIGGTPDVYSVKFNPTGDTLAAVVGVGLQFRDMSTGSGMPTSGLTNLSGNKQRMSFSPNGQWFALMDNTLSSSSRRLVQLVTGTWTNVALATFTPNETYAPAFNNDSTKVIMPGQQANPKEIALYEGLGGTITRTFVNLTAAEGDYVQGVHWLPDGENILVISQSYGPNMVYATVLNATTYALNPDHQLAYWSWPGQIDEAILGPAPPFIGAGPGGVLGSDGLPVSVTAYLYDRQTGALVNSSFSWANGAYGFSRFFPWGPGVDYMVVLKDDSTPPLNDLIVRVQT